MTELTDLALAETGTEDIAPLFRLTELRWLDLSSNRISNIDVLAVLKKMAFLFLSSNGGWAPGVIKISGIVVCDVNEDGYIDSGDEPLGDVQVMSGSELLATTNNEGYYEFYHPRYSSIIISLNEETLPADVAFIDPSENEPIVIS